VLHPDTPEVRELPSKITLQLKDGDDVSVQTPGGGGSEPAWRRPVGEVAADVSLGKISLQRARLAYGVVLDPVTLAVDEAATARQRAEMAHDPRRTSQR